MKKELVMNGQQGTIATLKKRLEMVEKKLAEIESNTENNKDKAQENTEPISENKGVVPALTLINKDNIVSGPDRAERSHHRERVLALWNKGNSVTEIASNTGLGKGEIELIISLKNSSYGADAGSGKA
ncbi:MAG: DUF6115 domain-containing protein [Bacillota bacterium]